VEVYYNGNASERRSVYSGHMTSSIWEGERSNRRSKDSSHLRIRHKVKIPLCSIPYSYTCRLSSLRRAWLGWPGRLAIWVLLCEALFWLCLHLSEIPSFMLSSFSSCSLQATSMCMSLYGGALYATLPCTKPLHTVSGEEASKLAIQETFLATI